MKHTNELVGKPRTRRARPVNIPQILAAFKGPCTVILDVGIAARDYDLFGRRHVRWYIGGWVLKGRSLEMNPVSVTRTS